MNAPMPINREVFARHVKRALASFYDHTYLQTSPLARIASAEQRLGETAAATLRRILRDAIEALRPHDLADVGGPEWLGYRVLWSRYIHRKSQVLVCDELGIARSSYYRTQQQAVEALASILWQRYQDGIASDVSQSEILPAGGLGETARDEAVRLAQESARKLVNLAEMVRSVQETISPLFDQEGIALHVTLYEPLAPMQASFGLLRQALLSLLSEAMEWVREDSIYLAVHQQGGHTVWHLRGLRGYDPEPWQPDEKSGFAFAAELLRAYGGRWEVASNQTETTITFSLPAAKAQRILIVDDDNDTIRLYRRWLEEQNYVVGVARTAEHLELELGAHPPDLILLDLLMPQWDGWSALQRIKAHPTSAHIPVVISSVLSQPRLALALGASAVLCKPISEADLLQTIMRLLAPTNSQA